MTLPDFTPIPVAPSNTHNPPAPVTTIADRHRAQYTHPGLWTKLRPWLLAGAFGLLVGGAAAVYASYQVMPPTATHVQNVFVTINGRPAVILSGDVVYDTAPLSLSPTPAAGQP